jgi:hypothetical protein
MMRLSPKKTCLRPQRLVAAGILAVQLTGACAQAPPPSQSSGQQSGQTQGQSQTPPTAPPRPGQPGGIPMLKDQPGPKQPRNLPDPMAGRAGVYYRMVWGVDSLSVKAGESGEMIRFSYRVLDPNKALAIRDKKIQPALIDPQAGVSLTVPEMDQIGPLRQSGTPEAGKEYWMAFSNAGLHVKRGDRVNIVIGTFHANNLMVQ